MGRETGAVQNRFSTWLLALSTLCILTLPAGLHAQPGMRLPDFPGMLQEVESGEKGIEAAKRLEQEKQRKNKYRGGSEEPPLANMMKLYDKILMKGPGDPSADKWYSPHLRDTQYWPFARGVVAQRRAESGLASWWYGFFCIECRNGLGGKKSACPFCQPDFFGCPGQEWYDKDLRWECCSTLGDGTRAYRDFVQDSNFKICCVKEEFKDASTEEISCKFPKGDGWAGLFEYYYPTIALGWENDRTTTMIASKQEVQKCLGETRPLMEQNGVDWVDKAIKKNLEQVEKLQSDGDGAPTPGAPGVGSTAEVRSKIQEDIQDVRPKDEELQFADSLQGAGLTMRINLPAMRAEYRRQVALAYCMREDQLMKIMDTQEDPIQRQDKRYEQIPIWANYCKEGATLMTNPDESLKLFNLDGTPTNLALGTLKWKQDPLFCQRINAQNNPFMKEFFGGVLEKSGGAASGFDALNPGAHGFTCREGGKLNGSLAPVSMYRHAAVERRTAIGDLALGFLIAGGIYSPSMADSPLMNGGLPRDARSYYKRFEPQAYSKLFGVFSGKQFVGGGSNEKNQGCRPVQGENYEAGGASNRSDRLYISDVTHKDVFTQEIIDNPPGEGRQGDDKEFNRYVQEWAQPSGQNKITNRGLDEKSSNYAAAFRIFATCPKGFVRWRHNDGLTRALTIDPVCGEEFLGGSHSPIGRPAGQ